MEILAPSCRNPAGRAGVTFIVKPSFPNKNKEEA
jgi:hypothetical protein